MSTPLGLPGNLREDLQKLWEFVREVSGDDAYERYLAHLKSFHPDREPLDRKTFFREEMDRKWTGVRRCC